MDFGACFAFTVLAYCQFMELLYWCELRKPYKIAVVCTVFFIAKPSFKAMGVAKELVFGKEAEIAF